MRVFLIGFMGSGKTTMGRKLAARMKLRFIDLDHYIEYRTRHTISSIFRLVGEDGFRTVEHNLLKEVIRFDNVIIATGGGTPCFFNNLNIINDNGISIYLHYTADFLAARLMKAKKKRPLIANKTEEELTQFINTTLIRRESFYREAHYILDSESANLDFIVELLGEATQ